MSVRLLDLSPATHASHPMHAPDRIWEQTNCSIDVWVELLHALDLAPEAAAAFSVAADFEGDQWTFYKYPPEDLRACFGIDVHEMQPWRDVATQVAEQLAAGRFMTIEVDSFHLPDTAGVAYGIAHVKSTIVANEIDAERRYLAYFHNAGYHELSGDDFDAVFRLGAHAGSVELLPYTELVRLERLVRRDAADLARLARTQLADHLDRRPSDNPVRRMATRVEADLPWLQGAGAEAFHDYAFATVRQCGASAETAASFCCWLAEHDPAVAEPLQAAAEQWSEMAETAKLSLMKLARVARGRSTSLEEVWDRLARAWEQAQGRLDAAVS